nr:OmpA family protein [Bacteroidota bacterium]
MLNAHADDRGNESYNLNLSKKRAKVIETYLKNEIIHHQIKTKAFGESRPAIPCLTPGCTEEEHQKNRRTAFHPIKEGEIRSK